MWQQIFDMAINNGLWAVLFLCMLVYMLKDANKREQKYRATIDGLLGRLDVVEQIREDTAAIRGDTAALVEAAEVRP